ncbi:ead/Ea22-like family protein [Citrobacter freundii]|uniref:ead/Ea22-like family protein n=1 Tax=Citrobacter freundii TaxID=546 RepID=UPI0027E3BB8E|nr:ead/Ea22-like family protein [Citrobacter freundii]WME25053.1 ead/Ea22-like family protein [Citrobacter freundii]
MTALNKHAELRQLAEKASQGEWWSDVVETDGEYGDGEDRASGYHSYAVYVGSESLLDMTNSTASCIHEEWDHDYHIAWDETAKRNAEFIAAANPDTVLALLDELEAKDRLNTELIEKQRLIDICQGQGLEHRIAAEKRAETAEKRVAELESRTVTLPPRAPENLAACLDGYDKWVIATTFRDTWNACLSEVMRMNAAGIGVKGE